MEARQVAAEVLEVIAWRHPQILIGSRTVDQRIEKGLVAKLEGVVGSEFVHMEYGEAIRVLEQANEKFKFSVKWASTCSRGTSAI